VDRRQFLRRSIVAAGSAAVAGRMALPTPALGATGDRMGNVYSDSPCSYWIHDLMQDCTNTGGLALGNPVFAPQGDDYRIRMYWKASTIDIPTQYNALGGITFRGADDQNYYYFVFFLDHVGIARIRNNVGGEVATAPRPVNTNHPAKFTLVMHGNRFIVKDNAVTGSPVIIDWTDDLNASPQGNHIDHWTRGGVLGYWVRASGRPVLPPGGRAASTSSTPRTRARLGGPVDPRRVKGGR